MQGYYILSYFICQEVFSIKWGGLSNPDGLRKWASEFMGIILSLFCQKQVLKAQTRTLALSRK